MRGLLCGFLIIGLLGACQPNGQTTAGTLTPQQQTYVDVTRGCSAMAHSLKVLAAARAQGRLSPEQVAAVDQALAVATPTCTAATPTVDGETALEQINAMLEQMIFASGAPSKGGTN